MKRILYLNQKSFQENYMSKKLKPCPFCGVTPVLVKKMQKLDRSGIEKTLFDVRCGTAGCYLCNGADLFLYEEEVVVLWNRRSYFFSLIPADEQEIKNNSLEVAYG